MSNIKTTQRGKATTTTKPVAPKKETKNNKVEEIKNSDLTYLATLLAKVGTQKLNIEEIKGIVRLQSVVNKKVSDLAEFQEKLLTGYGLKPIGQPAVYNWNGHKKFDEINAKVDELMNDVLEIYPVRMLSEDKFYGAVTGMSVGDIVFLKTFMSVDGDKDKD